MDRSLGALADARRRAVVELLCRRPHRAGELAEELGTSPALLSRHLKVLRASGLVIEEIDEEDRRARVYRIQREQLTDLRSWIEELEAFWGEQLASFKEYAERTRGSAKGK